MKWKDILRKAVEDVKKESPPTEFHVDDEFVDTNLYFVEAPISREDFEAFLTSWSNMIHGT